MITHPWSFRMRSPLYYLLPTWYTSFVTRAIFSPPGILWAEFLLLSLVFLLYAVHYGLQRCSTRGQWIILDRCRVTVNSETTRSTPRGSRRTSPSYRYWVWHCVSVTTDEFSGVPLSWNTRPNFMLSYSSCVKTLSMFVPCKTKGSISRSIS